MKTSFLLPALPKNPLFYKGSNAGNEVTKNLHTHPYINISYYYLPSLYIYIFCYLFIIIGKIPCGIRAAEVTARVTFCYLFSTKIKKALCSKG
jgi:hypothetical protein